MVNLFLVSMPLFSSLTDNVGPDLVLGLGKTKN